MPQGKHLPKANSKQQRMYEHIVDTGKNRYGKRVKEVAARTVRKLQSKFGKPSRQKRSR